MINEYSKEYINACISYNIDNISDNHNQIQALIKCLPFCMDRYLTEQEKDIFVKLSNGMKQTTLAEYYGVSQPTISRIYKHCIEVLRDKLVIVIEAIKQYERIIEQNDN